MTEDDARAWVRERFGVSRETLLARYADMLVSEAEQQNLIAASTIDSLWSRHLVDSAQLAPLAEGAAVGAWLDVGSGAGLPGIVVGILTDRQVILCEPRARRVEFLEDVIAELGLGQKVSVERVRVEAYVPAKPIAVISARAVAELSQLLASARHCGDLSTVWVLPKGRNAQSEVDAARRKWQGVFHVEPSVTEPDSGIVVARKVQPR